MTFLNASLLAGLLAIAIPIAIHLISRRQPRRIVFPATRFLKAQLESSRSRLRVQRWWLLLLRILALAALAGALARPTIETSMAPRWIAAGLLIGLALLLGVLASVALVRGGSAGLRYGLAAVSLMALLAAVWTAGAAAGRGPDMQLMDDAPVAMAIVIDNSIRSSRLQPAGGGQADGERIIDVVREHAAWMLGRYPSDSRVAIIDRSPRPAAFALDGAGAARQIERTEPLAVTRPLIERIEAAVRLVRTSELQRRIVLVITDLTQRSFPEQQWEGAALGELLAEQPPIRLQLLDVGIAPAGNRRLESLRIADVTPPRMTQTAISANLVLEGSAADRDPPAGQDERDSASIMVELLLYDRGGSQAAGLPLVRDGETVLPPLRSVDRTSVRPAAGATGVLLSVPPLEIGTHHGVVRIVGDDELADDDQRYFTLQVQPPTRLLLVADEEPSAAVIGEALTAPLAIDDPLAQYEVDIAAGLPSQRPGYDDYDVIIMIDPSLPTPANLSDLRDYLDGGGRLLSLLGPSFYPGTSLDDRGATAVPLGPWDGLRRRWRVPQPGTFLQMTRPGHPAIAPLAEVAGGVPWNVFRVFQYWQLEPVEGDVVVMRYAGGEHPALVARGGNHLIMTTPLPALVAPSRSWNELFAGSDAWPAFLLIRELVRALVDTDRGARNVTITDLPTIRLDDSAAEEGGQEFTLQMFPPRGPAVPLRASDTLITVGGLEWPGTYWLRGTGVTTGFSANLLAGQTALARLDPQLLDDWIGAERFDLVRDRQGLRQAEGRGDPTRPLYGWLLLVMVAAFSIEQLLANRFYRSGRRSVALPSRRAA